ncbi:uncharacterized protein LOC109598866 [Aethina tumida]|uniref:uncharacterized protein LOC109598866 n=1 Tax=Aethina tumida TaxID=116153 RepID=UPI002147F073|nr:uncharacterized protein LOC109598866 [Aethina tumida]
MNKVAVCVLLVAILASASSKALTRTQLKSFYSNIPEEERASYLRYNLLKGYEALQKSEFEKYAEIPTEVSAAIYESMIQNHLVQEKQHLSSLKDVICFPSGCIDLDDPGVHP